MSLKQELQRALEAALLHGREFDPGKFLARIEARDSTRHLLTPSDAGLVPVPVSAGVRPKGSRR